MTNKLFAIYIIIIEIIEIMVYRTKWATGCTIQDSLLLCHRIYEIMKIKYNQNGILFCIDDYLSHT